MRSLVMILLALLGGCTPVPMAPSASDQSAKMFLVRPLHANIYVYRSDPDGALAHPEISFDGDDEVALAWNTYFLVEVEPGTHTVASYHEEPNWLDPDRAAPVGISSLIVHAEPGTSYFVRAHAVGRQDGSTAEKLELVSDSVGHRAVSRRKLAESRF